MRMTVYSEMRFLQVGLCPLINVRWYLLFTKEETEWSIAMNYSNYTVLFKLKAWLYTHFIQEKKILLILGIYCDADEIECLVSMQKFYSHSCLNYLKHTSS